MSINDVGIKDGFLGYWRVSKKGTQYFVPKGRAVYLASVEESIENDDVYLTLRFEYLGREKSLRIKREEISDPALLKLLARKGGAGSRAAGDCIVDVLLAQEEDFAANGGVVQPVYENLGWIKLPRIAADGTTIEFDLCYRAQELIGAHEGSYIGPYDVRPYGNYAEWKQLIEEEVIHSPVLQLLLIAALAAEVNGLIAPVTGGENPIIHVFFASGKGKSTALFLCCSVAGRAFDGERAEYDADGNIVTYRSLFQSWSSTDNAMVATQAGNRGMPTILNELGKSLSQNMTRLVFDLSEGSDKKRLSKDLSARVSEGYSMVFISCGESSLLDRCKSKYEGLRIRVMEINQPPTNSAKQARRIKQCCLENGGFAVPMMASHIIERGGVDYVLPIFTAWVTRLEAEFPPSPSVERFVEKFAALLMTTAEIATQALGIAFDMDGLLAFLKEYDAEHGASRNAAAGSYELVVETCRTNEHRFNIRSDRSFTGGNPFAEEAEVSPAECWGRITNMVRPYGDRIIVQEIELRRLVLEKILRDHDFENIETCVAAWKEAEVLDFEDDSHPTRARKVDMFAPDGAKERVFVFRVFSAPEDVEAHRLTLKKREERSKPKSTLASAAKSSGSMSLPHSQIRNLLAEEEGGDEDEALDST